AAAVAGATFASGATGTTPSGMTTAVPPAGTATPAVGATVTVAGAAAPVELGAREPVRVWPRVGAAAFVLPGPTEAMEGLTSITVVPRKRSRTSVPRLSSPSREAAG